MKILAMLSFLLNTSIAQAELSESFIEATEKASATQIQNSIQLYQEKLNYLKDKTNTIKDYEKSTDAKWDRKSMTTALDQFERSQDDFSALLDQLFWNTKTKVNSSCSQYYTGYKNHFKRIAEMANHLVGDRLDYDKEGINTSPYYNDYIRAQFALEMIIDYSLEYAMLMANSIEDTSGLFSLGKSKCRFDGRSQLIKKNAQNIEALMKLKMVLFGKRGKSDINKIAMQYMPFIKNEKQNQKVKAVTLAAGSIAATFVVGPMALPYLSAQYPLLLNYSMSALNLYIGYSAVNIGIEIFQAQNQNDQLISSYYGQLQKTLNHLTDTQVSFQTLGQVAKIYQSSEYDRYKENHPEQLAKNWLPSALNKYKSHDALINEIEDRLQYLKSL